MPATPQLGAVMVFWRRSPDSGLGHVAFYFAEDERTYHVLGGNQSNMVSVGGCGKTGCSRRAGRSPRLRPRTRCLWWTAQEVRCRRTSAERGEPDERVRSPRFRGA